MADDCYSVSDWDAGEMIAELIIPGEFPGMNEIIKAAKSHYGQYNDMKQTYTDRVHWLAKKAPKMDKPVWITITWITQDLKRDPDNVMAGQKFILDGLKEAGVLPNDTRKWIVGISHRFGLDRMNPRVEVVVEEEELNFREGTD